MDFAHNHQLKQETCLDYFEKEIKPTFNDIYRQFYKQNPFTSFKNYISVQVTHNIINITFW